MYAPGNPNGCPGEADGGMDVGYTVTTNLFPLMHGH